MIIYYIMLRIKKKPPRGGFFFVLGDYALAFSRREIGVSFSHLLDRSVLPAAPRSLTTEAASYPRLCSQRTLIKSTRLGSSASLDETKAKAKAKNKKKSVPKIKSQIYVLKMVDIGREGLYYLHLINKELET